MPSGYVGILSFELHLGESASLKDKRMVVRSVKAQLANRVGASIAEVDRHDAWQLARLTIACVAREQAEARRLLDDAERWLHAQAFEPTWSEREIVSLDDER